MGQPWPQFPSDVQGGDEATYSPAKDQNSLLAAKRGTQQTKRIETDANGNVYVRVAQIDSGTSQVEINYPLVALGANPGGLPQGTAVAIIGEPAGSPIGLTLVFTTPAQAFWYGVIGGAGAGYIRQHA